MHANNKPLILVDGSSYFYRAYHALPSLMNSKGFPTGAVFGMVNMLKRLITDYQPEYMGVIFDAPGKTFRDEIYAEYKATRQETPSDLVRQIEPIHRLIQALGLPILIVEGVEADDVIATLSEQAFQSGIKTLISTSDKDLAQLVNDHITLVNTMSNTTLDIPGVEAKFGVPPERIIDYLSLIGDTSDNIPGVPLVGPKTAAKWLQTYGSLENIMAHADEIPGRAGENLRHTLPILPMIKLLVTIKRDVPLAISVGDLKIKSADKPTLLQLYRELEFKNWLAELLQETAEKDKERYSEYAIIETETALTTLIDQLNQASEVAFTIATTTLNYMNAELVGFSFAIQPGYGIYIPIGHKNTHSRQLEKDYVLARLKPILENPKIKKIGQNLKFDIEVLARIGIQLQGADYDVLVESYLLDSASGGHEITSLALKYLGWRMIPYEEIAGKASKQIPFDHIDMHQAAVHVAEHVDVILRLHQILWPRVKSEAKLKKLFEKIEMPLIGVLANIERNGVLIDPVKLEKQGAELQKRLLELEQEAFQLAGGPFNMNSPKQLQEILFTTLKLPVLQKTPTGQPSTADAVLQELALEFRLPQLIIEYRSLSKLISTYTAPLVAQIDPVSGRVHTIYHQTLTVTGRLSSSDPNLQNIPIRSPEGRRIRQAFVASEGYTILSADYSQIELRLMAHLSEDPNLLHAFATNADIHVATAAEVWDVSIDQVTTEMRRNAKAINFGLIYGMSAFGLTRQLGIDRNAAQAYIDRYFSRYPGVKEYMDNTCKQARKLGYVQTLWGRKLFMPDINSSQIIRQKAAERAAINAPLQGSAADIIKLAMIHIAEWLQQKHIDAKLIMQVHDELVFEAKVENLDEIIAGIHEHMGKVIQLKVPLIVSIGRGDNWDEASQH